MRKQIQSFKFECLKWPILAEMTAKSGIYFHFLCQQGGGEISPPVVLRGGGGSGPPLAETLVKPYIYITVFLNKLLFIFSEFLQTIIYPPSGRGP